MPLASGLYFHLSQDGVVETPPVVLLHGVGGMHLFWPPQIRRLPGYRVFALDLPGHGKSNHGGGLQTVEAYAQQIVAWMETVDLHRAVFVGHSMGGAIALNLSTKFPEHVLGLGLFSSGVRLNIPHDILADASSTTTFYKSIESLVSWSFGSSVSEQLLEVTASRFREVRPSVLCGDLIASEQFDCNERLAEIRLPALVLCGEEDRIAPLRYSQLLARIIPGAILQIIPQAGHMVMLEQPDLVAKSLVAFLEKIPYHAGEVNSHVPGN
jgi:pimeloyl-ACP methyl ester carboxylesterase